MAIKVLSEIRQRSGHLSSAHLRVQLPKLLQHVGKSIVGCMETIRRQLLFISTQQMRWIGD